MVDIWLTIFQTKHSKILIFQIITEDNKYARGESNPNRWNRNPLFYPLNYGRIILMRRQMYNLLMFSPNIDSRNSSLSVSFIS